jgi:hypothetical protein
MERFARGERTDTDQWDALMEDVVPDRTVPRRGQYSPAADNGSRGL